MKTTLKAAFLAKYPRYMNILSMYEQANDCPGDMGEYKQTEIGKVRRIHERTNSPNERKDLLRHV